MDQRLSQELCPNNRSPQIDILAPETEVQNVSRGEILLLNAVASDDALPEGGYLTTGWELEEGDAAGIVLPTSLSGEARFTKKGFYRLRVRASDGERQIVSLPVSVTVRPDGMILIFR